MNKYTLHKHTKTAKYCLKLRGNVILNFKCNDCNKSFSRKHHLVDHMKICKKRESNIITKNLNDIIKKLYEELDKKDSIIQTLQDKLENIAIKAVQRPFEDQTTIDIDIDDSQFTVCDSESEEDDEEEYKLSPLDVGKGYTIEHREEDGYINVTNLCKSGGKQFKHWKSIQKTKAFIRVLSSEVGIPTTDLIKLGTGSKCKNSQTWVHPQVAINIAQWISPKFDVKVSGWIYEVMMTGKVDITNTKSYKELQRENKGHKLRIQYLSNKYLKRQSRTEYKEKYVIYILTTNLMKKERRYILGKATDLTPRLSTYNKSDEHEVVYFQECGDEETMSLVENTVFHHLRDCREQANRERFILPEGEKISYFSDTIKKSIEFFKK
jgi:hypothetical protein